MAKRALRKKEDIEAVPIDQPVDLDLSADDDPIIDIEADPQKPAPKTNGAVIHADEDAPNSDDDTTALRKQVEDLRRAETVRAADFERQLQEANRRTRELEQQNSQHQNSELEAQYDSVLNAINAAEAEAQAAQAAYEKAFEAGDSKALGEAQRKLSRSEARLESLEQGKGVLESRREAAKTVPKKEDAPVTITDPFEMQISQLPDAAKNWLRGHRDYMTDARKNAKIQSAHWDVLDGGVTAYSPEYFESLEQHLGLRDRPDPESRKTPVSAPVSRDIPSPSSGRSTPTKVTLTAEQREMARLSMPHLPAGEAEKLYAQNLLKLESAKKQGHYRES